MSRYGRRQRALDEMAFPIRVKVAIPPGGLGRTIDELHRWLREEVGSTEYATHSGHGLGVDALCLYLRRPEDLARFLVAFPLLELADGTRLRDYTSPLWPGGSSPA
jgi:hypothetical protein